MVVEAWLARVVGGGALRPVAAPRGWGGGAFFPFPAARVEGGGGYSGGSFTMLSQKHWIDDTTRMNCSRSTGLVT